MAMDYYGIPEKDLNWENHDIVPGAGKEAEAKVSDQNTVSGEDYAAENIGIV